MSFAVAFHRERWCVGSLLFCVAMELGFYTAIDFACPEHLYLHAVISSKPAARIPALSVPGYAAVDSLNVGFSVRNRVVSCVRSSALLPVD